MPGYTIERSLLVQAPVEQVWEALVDVKSWPEWKPFIRKTRMKDAALAPGVNFSMTICVKGAMAYPVPVKVTILDRPREMAWTGGLPGLVISTHSFILEESQGRTRLTSKEHFRGALVKLMLLFVTEQDLQSLHDRWLEAVAKRLSPAESGSK